MLLAILMMVGVAWGFNKVFRRYALIGLTMKRDFSKAVVENGEEFQVVVTVENQKLVPVPFLQVNEGLPAAFAMTGAQTGLGGNSFLKTTMSLMPFQRIQRSFRCRCLARGRYFLQEATLAVGDLLGLEVFLSPVTRLKELVVLPKRLDLGEHLAASGDYTGDISVKRWIIDDPLLTIGIRDYTGAEPLKAIHWPSSLKTGKLMVRQYDFTINNQVLIMLDCDRNSWIKSPDTVETCLSLARTIGEEFDAAGTPYALLTNGWISGKAFSREAVRAGCGSSHLSVFLEKLGRISEPIEPFDMYLTSVLGQPGSYNTYVFITPCLSNQYIVCLNHLAGLCEKLIVLTASADNLDCLDHRVRFFTVRGEPKCAP